MNSSPLIWKESKHFNNYKLFPSQLRACIIGSSGCGKTKLMYKLLLDHGLLDYDTLVLCSPSLQQPEYKIIIKAFKSGLNKQQVLNLFKYQNEIKDIDKSISTLSDKISSLKLPKPGLCQTITFEHPDQLPNPEELNPTRKNKVLLVIDDCSIIRSDIPTKYYSYARPLNINLFYLSQTYTRVPKFIRDNTNLFFLFKINNRDIKDVVFNEIGNDFDNANEMSTFFKNQIKNKHDFIIYNKDSNNWLDYRLELIEAKNDQRFDINIMSNLKIINSNQMASVRSSSHTQLQQAQNLLKAYNAEQNTLQNMNDRKLFESSLYEQTKSIFKPITESTDRTTSSIKDLGIEKVNKNLNKIDKNIDTGLDLRTSGRPVVKATESDLSCLSKTEIIDMINNNINIDNLFNL